MLRHRLDTGWVHIQANVTVTDPRTGNTRKLPGKKTPIRAALQRNELMNEVDETSDTLFNDTRVLILRSPLTVSGRDTFVSPEGEVWKAVADGMKRHRPGQHYTYTAVYVRRAAENDG